MFLVYSLTRELKTHMHCKLKRNKHALIYLYMCMPKTSTSLIISFDCFKKKEYFVYEIIPWGVPEMHVTSKYNKGI